MFTRKSLLDIENLNLQQHTFRYILVQVKPKHTIHICTAGSLTRKKKKKVKKSSDWEATHDVSGRLILLRLEGRLWRARSFHCFSNKKPLWGATDPHPPPRWHLAHLLCPQNPSKMAQVDFYFFYNWSRWLPVGQNL